MYSNDNPHKIKNYVIIYLCNSKPVCISFLCRNVCIQIVPIDLIFFHIMDVNGNQNCLETNVLQNGFQVTQKTKNNHESNPCEARVTE